MITVVRTGVSEECGCPEEEFIYKNICVMIHYEEDGSGHIILDAGDWEQEHFIQISSFDELRQKAIDIIDSLPEQ